MDLRERDDILASPKTATKIYDLSAKRSSSRRQRNSDNSPHSANSRKSNKINKSKSNNSSNPFSLIKEDSNPKTLGSNSKRDSLVTEQRPSMDGGLFSHLPMNVQTLEQPAEAKHDNRDFDALFEKFMQDNID